MSRQWNSVRIADAIGSIESAASTGALKRALMGALMAAALGFAGGAAAQDAGAVGLWRTIDDETKQPKALVRITESGGVLSGRIEKLFNPSKPDPVCEACTDDRKGRPIEGMTILTGLKPVGDGWEEGQILDPNNGKVYRAKARLAEGGRQLEVRGFIGIALFGRTQTWLREQ